jgi:lysophospholipase L1-like esterase
LVKKRVLPSVFKIDKDKVEVKGTKTLKYFYDLKPNHTDELELDWLPEKVIQTINADALNERYNYLPVKPDNTFRIMALGDSFTYGVFISTNKNWTEVLEDELNDKFVCKNQNKFEVINLGVYGYDVEYAVERFRLRGKKYDPDLIVWMLTDSTRILEKTYPSIEKCQAQDQELTDGPSNYDCSLEAQRELLKQLGRDNMDQYIADSFDKIFDFYHNKILVVDIDEAHDKILEKTAYKEFIDELGLIFHNKNYLKLPDRHPNIEGHRFLADRIYEYLIKNKIIDCE